jgi:hypothetical protein
VRVHAFDLRVYHLAGEEDAMFAWRKKTEGFEWHQYIRTAVRHRRQQRHERMVEARRAAGQQVQAAGVALVAGSKAAGVAAKESAKALDVRARWVSMPRPIRRLRSPRCSSSPRCLSSRR